MLTSATSKGNDKNDHSIFPIELKINIPYEILIPAIKLPKLDLIPRINLTNPISTSPLRLEPPSNLNKILGDTNRIIWKLCNELTTLIFQHSNTKTVCDLMLVCRLFLEVANSEKIRSKLGDDKFLNRNVYPSTFFASPLSELNSLEKLAQAYRNNACLNFIDSIDIRNPNSFSELIAREAAPPEQPGDGTNGFVFC